jgi:hypothetical protein
MRRSTMLACVVEWADKANHGIPRHDSPPFQHGPQSEIIAETDSHENVYIVTLPFWVVIHNCVWFWNRFEYLKRRRDPARGCV